MKKIYLIDTGVNFLDTINLYSYNGTYHDPCGHGTPVAHIIRSMSKAPIVNIKIPEKPTAKDLVQALLFVSTQAPGIASINWVVEFNESIKLSLQTLLDQGFIIVSPVGNFAEDFSNYLPASMHGVISVGSINKSGNIASHCNFSKIKNIDFYANGTNIQTVNHLGDPYSMSGTCAAAAQVTGLLSRSFFDARPNYKVQKHLNKIKSFYAAQIQK